MKFKKKQTNDAYWNRVFSSNSLHFDAEAFPASPGWFPMSKTPEGMVFPRSALMRDLLVHLETDPDVVAVALYPEAAEYWTIATNGEPTVRPHVPDVAVRRRRGAVSVIDVGDRLPIGSDATWVDERTIDLQVHYEGLGAQYYLLEEGAIHLQPLFDNRRDMWQHKPYPEQDPRIDRVAADILAQPLPLSIREIARRLSAHCSMEEWRDESGPLYSAVKQLVMSGRIEVDLYSRFSEWTVLRLPARLDNLPKRGLRRRPLARALRHTASAARGSVPVY